MVGDPIDVETLARATLRWFDEHATGGIFTTDVELRVRSWNQWLRAATGIAEAHAVGRPLFDVMSRVGSVGRLLVLTMSFSRSIFSLGRYAISIPSACCSGLT